MTTSDERVHKQVLEEVMTYLQTLSFNCSPPEISREVHHIIRNVTRSKDPYKKVKDQANERAEKLFPHLRKLVKEAEDPMQMAVKLAIVGNVIDFGTMNRFNVQEMINTAIKNKEINQKSYKRFVNAVETAETILYIADNTGEIFFDKLLLEELREKQLVYVVRANPIINDVTQEDARFAGIDKFAEVVEADAENNRSAPGMLLKYASPSFLERFQSADVVIAKGQGNYEGLSDVEREVFFLLLVKCPLVARDIGVEVGQMVLKVNR